MTTLQVDWRDRLGRPVEPVLDARGHLRFVPRAKTLRDLVLWASGKSNYFISKVENQVWNATAYSFPGTLYFALWTATLSATSTGSTAGEASYTGYARVGMTANTTNFPLSSGGSAITNAVAITWPSNSGSNQTMTYAAVLDSVTTGQILYWGSITSTTVNTGDTPQVAVSGLTATEA